MTIGASTSPAFTWSTGTMALGKEMVKEVSEVNSPSSGLRRISLEWSAARTSSPRQQRERRKKRKFTGRRGGLVVHPESVANGLPKLFRASKSRVDSEG